MRPATSVILQDQVTGKTGVISRARARSGSSWLGLSQNASCKTLMRPATSVILQDQVTGKTGVISRARARGQVRQGVEGAWAYRMKARIGRHKVDRIEALPKVVRDIAWRAQLRLCTRYRRLSARGKTANVVNVAIAREMVGFIWSIACTVQSAPKTA